MTLGDGGGGGGRHLPYQLCCRCIFLHKYIDINLLDHSFNVDAPYATRERLPLMSPRKLTHYVTARCIQIKIQII